jgi:hypothetical protein
VPGATAVIVSVIALAIWSCTEIWRSPPYFVCKTQKWYDVIASKNKGGGGGERPSHVEERAATTENSQPCHAVPKMSGRAQPLQHLKPSECYFIHLQYQPSWFKTKKKSVSAEGS